MKLFLKILFGIVFIALTIIFYNSVFVTLDKTVQSTIIAAIGTVFASVGAVIYNQRRAKERELEEAHRPMKVEVYKNFMKIMFNLIGSSKSSKAEQDKIIKNLEKGFFDFSREIISWGSPGVIKAYSKFRTSTNSGDNFKIILIFDELLKEIRIDLGNSNRGIKKGELIKLFLTDPEKVDEYLNKQII